MIKKMVIGIETAKFYLHNYGYSVVVVKGGCVEMVSSEKGIMPLLMMYDKCPSKLENALLADKIIGKAAAFILAETKVKQVYADIMSSSAVRILEMKQIIYTYGKLVPEIMNRSGNGLCPLENLCKDIDKPLDGIVAITGYICRSYCNGDSDRADKGKCANTD